MLLPRPRAQRQGAGMRAWTHAYGRSDRHEAAGNAMSPARRRDAYSEAREMAAKFILGHTLKVYKALKVA